MSRGPEKTPLRICSEGLPPPDRSAIACKTLIPVGPRCQLGTGGGFAGAAPNPGMLHVHRGPRLAATVTVDDIHLAPAIEVLEPDHPVRRWAVCVAVFGQHILSGAIAGPYEAARADLFARNVLIPDDDFCGIAELPAVWLAEHFNVPLEQIFEKREDLRALAIF